MKTASDGAWAKTGCLADDAWDNKPDTLVTLKLREVATVLALNTIQSTALHTGVKGYLMRGPTRRRVREATLVTTVTPAIKHLCKEIAALGTAQ